MKLQDFIATIQRSLPESLPRRVSSDVRLIRELLLSRYQTVMSRHPWSFLHVWVNEQLPPAYTTGSITVTQGSKTVTGSGTAWTASQAGWLLLTGESVPIAVSSVEGAGSLTLETEWGEASKSDLSYKLAPLRREVARANTAAIIGVWSKNGRLQEKSVYYLDSLDPKRTGGGTTWAYSSRGFGVIGPVFEVYPYPTEGAMIRVLLLAKPTLPSLLSDDLVFNNPSVLELGVRADLFQYAHADSGDRKFLDMAMALGQQFEDVLERLIEEDRVATSWLHSVVDVEPRVPVGLDPYRHDTLPW